MKVTVIIPAYNAEKYIGNCIESIINQTFKDLEIVIIDDGSTDRTRDLLDYYLIRDDRIKVLYKENEGQSIARNRGLDLATGDYICFSDADDSMPIDAIEVLMNITKKKQYDVVSGSYYRVENPIHQELIRLPCSSGEVSRRGNEETRKRFHSIKTRSVFGYVWGKIYKRSFLLKHQLRFDDIRKIYMEDTLFNLKLFSNNPTYYFLNYPVYSYYIRINSTTRRYDEGLEDKMIVMLENYKEYLKSKNCYRKNFDLFLPLVMRVFCWSTIKNVPCSRNSMKYIYNTVKKFGENKSIRKAIYDKLAISSILKTRGMVEKLFFIVCLLGLRFQFYRFLSLMFFILYPINLLYVKFFVK